MANLFELDHELCTKFVPESSRICYICNLL